jgi:hypothetical protein
LVIGFIEHFYTQLVTTRNYSAIANSHTLQFTTARTYVFSSCCVFTNRFLVTASNGGRSPSSEFSKLPASHSNSSQGLNCGSPQTESLTHQPNRSTPLTNPQAGGHLTPTLSSHCRLKTPVIVVGPRYMASTRTTQSTPLRTAHLLLRPIPSNGCLQNLYLAAAIV